MTSSITDVPGIRVGHWTDLAAGTGANTGAKLTASANGQVPTYDSSQSQGLKVAYPPGYEFDYAERTSGALSVTNVTEGAADTFVSGNAVTYDGSTIVMIECFCPAARPDITAAGRNIKFVLYDGGSSIGILGTNAAAAAASDPKPVLLRRRLTPSNAAHTYHFKAFVSAGTGNMDAGAGGSGNNMPGYIRITRV